MTWFRVDDSFHSHPKVIVLTDKAVALWLKAGTWAARHLTDGHVPTSAVRSLGYRPAVAAELVAAGLWSLHPDDGWLFHDWDAYQPSRTAVKERRQADRIRQERARQRAKERATGRLTVVGDSDTTGGVTA